MGSCWQDKGRHASPHLLGQALVCTSFLLETGCLLGEVEPAMLACNAAEKRGAPSVGAAEVPVSAACKAKLGRSGPICSIPKQKADSDTHPWQRITSVSPLRWAGPLPPDIKTDQPSMKSTKTRLARGFPRKADMGTRLIIIDGPSDKAGTQFRASLATGLTNVSQLNLLMDSRI